MSRKSSKKGKKAGKSRRRRPSMMGAINFTAPAGLIVGAIAGNFVKKTLEGKLTVGGKDLTGPAVLVAGMLLPKFMKSPMGKAIGDGMIVSGGVTTIAEFIPAIPINGVDVIGLLSPATVQGVDVIGVTPVMPEQTIYPESENQFSY